MSIWDYVFDSSVRQRFDINNLKSQRRSMNKRNKASFLRSNVSNIDASERVEAIENDLAEAVLTLRAMYAYIRSTPGFDVKNFSEIISGIDLLDGVKDGKVTKKKGPR
jgi:hypothetical protein